MLVEQTIDMAETDAHKDEASSDLRDAEVSIRAWKENPAHEKHIKIIDDIEQAIKNLENAENEYV